jgi:exopolysaccharide/PEP-CTERM locus tyrosine autokinase
MSLVEMALDKLRSAQSRTSGKPAAAIPPAQVGSVVDTGVHRRIDDIPDSGKLIAIDRASLRSSGFLPESAFERRLADQYRQVKRPLLAHAFAADGPANARLIAVASALPGDGKTFTSINLALSLSRERDTSVLLVDADVAKCHASRLFGAAEEPGLLDALAEPALHPESLVIRTDLRSLQLLPAGKPRDGATELLSSARMAEISLALLARDPRRIIVFDSSPLLITSESRPIIDTVGQVALVVRAGVTPRQAVLDATAVLPTDKRVGIVLNQSLTALTTNYYGYGDYGADTPAG